MEQVCPDDASPAIVFGRPALQSVWFGPAQLRARAFAVEARRRARSPALIIGPRGCGKSTVLDQILLAMAPAQFFRISESWESGTALLTALLESAGLRAAGLADVDQRNLLQTHLDTLAREGEAVVIAVDDADRLTDDVWLELLRIAAMPAGSGRPFMLLVGRPEMLETLEHADPSAARALRERLHEMAAPTAADCAAYIEHRLRVAGLDPGHCPLGVGTLIGKLARGSFVRTNLLVQGAMLLARRRGLATLSEPLVLEATRTMAAAAAERGLVSRPGGRLASGAHPGHGQSGTSAGRSRGIGEPAGAGEAGRRLRAVRPADPT